MTTQSFSAAVPELLGQSDVYAELKRLARRQLHRQQQGATLNTTALVHEACLKLAGPRRSDPAEQAHWLNLAVRAMRQVLCDHARKRLLRQSHVDPAGADLIGELPDPEQQALAESRRLLKIDALLTELAEAHPRRAYVLDARFFGGLSDQETALAAGLSLRTVQREWQLAKEWLKRRLQDAD